jgi:hypothetical protein
MPGRVHIDRVEVELISPGLKLRMTLTEDGGKLGRCAVYRDHSKNLENIKFVAHTLHLLLADPMPRFAAQCGKCCCCGKSLTDITSRLRVIGPECIKYFSNVDFIANAVREKYRSLDDEWWTN